jgi:hypothetical protein
MVNGFRLSLDRPQGPIHVARAWPLATSVPLTDVNLADGDSIMTASDHVLGFIRSQRPQP